MMTGTIHSFVQLYYSSSFGYICRSCAGGTLVGVFIHWSGVEWSGLDWTGLEYMQSEPMAHW